VEDEQVVQAQLKSLRLDQDKARSLERQARAGDLEPETLPEILRDASSYCFL
jgi:hypothetical protein